MGRFIFLFVICFSFHTAYAMEDQEELCGFDRKPLRQLQKCISQNFIPLANENTLLIKEIKEKAVVFV